MARELTREEKAAIRRLVISMCANYDRECGCLPLTKPEVRKANTQQIKEKARTSIYEMLNRNKAIVAAEDAARKKETHKKQNMER